VRPSALSSANPDSPGVPSAAPRVYLDYAAFSPVDPRVVAVMRPFLEGGAGNPGAQHSLGLEARASVTRLKWREWEVLEGRARGAYRPGPVPAFQLEATVDSVTRDVLGFGAAVLAAEGSRDSLTWFSRARVGEGAGFLAGGRFARRADSRSGVITIGLDSLALQLPSDVWVLERPTALTMPEKSRPGMCGKRWVGA